MNKEIKDEIKKEKTKGSEKRIIERISAKKGMIGYMRKNISMFGVVKKQDKELREEIRWYDRVALRKKKMKKVKNRVKRDIREQGFMSSRKDMKSIKILENRGKKLERKKRKLKKSLGLEKKRMNQKKKYIILRILRSISEIIKKKKRKVLPKNKKRKMLSKNKGLIDINRKKNTLIRKIQRNYEKKRSISLERIVKRYSRGIERKYNDERTRYDIKQKLKEYMGIRFGIVYIRIKRRNIFATLTNRKRRVWRVVTAGGARKKDSRSKGYKRYKRSLIAREAIGKIIAKFCWVNKIRYINIFWYTFRLNRAILNIIREFPLHDILIGSIQYRRIRGHGMIRARARRRIGGGKGGRKKK